MSLSDDPLAAYDAELRTDAEMADAESVTRLGPLLLGTFLGGYGFITYRDLSGVADPADPADPAGLDRLVAAALAHFESDQAIASVEWKTRAHDVAPGLHEALLAHGFVPEESESVMIGAAAALAVAVPLPEGVRLRRVTAEADVRAMAAMQGEVFGSPGHVEELLSRMAVDPSIECWVAEAGGEIVCAGRLHPVRGTAFAGIWGGATRPAWRRQGIYRALTAARAHAALVAGKTLIHSDSTEDSRPILERYGFTKVTSTTPYVWSR